MSKVAMVTEKYWKIYIFSRSGTSQGIMLMVREVRKGLEKSGSWKISGYGS